MNRPRLFWIILFVALGLLAVYYSNQYIPSTRWTFQSEDLNNAMYARDIIVEADGIRADYIVVNIPRSELWSTDDFSKLRVAYVQRYGTYIEPCFADVIGSCFLGDPENKFQLSGDFRVAAVPGFADFDKDGRYEAILGKVILFYGGSLYRVLNLNSDVFPFGIYVVVDAGDGNYYVVARGYSQTQETVVASLFLVKPELRVMSYVKNLFEDASYTDTVFVDDVFVETNNVVYALVDDSDAMVSVYRLDLSSLTEEQITSVQFGGCEYIYDASFLDSNRDEFHVVCYGRNGEIKVYRANKYGDILDEIDVDRVNTSFRDVGAAVLDGLVAVSSGDGRFTLYDAVRDVYLDRGQFFGRIGKPSIIKLENNVFVIYSRYKRLYEDRLDSWLFYYDRSRGAVIFGNRTIYGVSGNYLDLSGYGHYRYPEGVVLDFSLLPEVFYTFIRYENGYYYLGHDYGIANYFVGRYNIPFLVPFAIDYVDDENVWIRIFAPRIEGSATFRIYYGEFNDDVLSLYRYWFSTHSLFLKDLGRNWTFGDEYIGTEINIILPVRVTINEAFNIGVLLTDVEGNPLTDQNVFVSLDGDELGSCVTNDSGFCAVTALVNTRGVYTVTAYYPGRSTYLPTSSDLTFEAHGYPVELNLVVPEYVEENTPFTILVSLSSSYDYPLTGVVSIYLDNNLVYQSSYTGSQIVYDINGLPAGEHYVVAFYSGDDYYDPVEVNRSITVFSPPPASTGGTSSPVSGVTVATPSVGVTAQPASPTVSGGGGVSTLVISLILIILLGMWLANRIHR